ncbi:MAG: ABC transporter permease subunit [Armatimonadetes bacterium]|nr:ABC transporter permease subunit [Armatimonadota bacterium]
MPKLTRTLTAKAPLHLALVAGSVLFAFPFVWLVTTTFKGDEEIFSERLNWVPKIPWYSPTSPYIDQRAYKPMRRPDRLPKKRWEAAERMLKTELWSRAREVAPTDIALIPDAHEQVVRGLWEEMRDALPAEALAGGKDALYAPARAAVTPGMVSTVWNRVNKRLALGDLRLLDASNRNVLVRSEAVTWLPWARNTDLGAAAIGAEEVGGEPGRRISYSDADGGVEVTASVTVPRPVERIALALHDDESWRHVDLLLLTPTGAFRSQRPFIMSNGQWQDVTWTFRPPRERQSLELLLVPAKTSLPLPSAGTLQLRLTISRTSPLRATFDKFARNYREAVRYVPFWTFARNSVILVVLNIIGQLFACSLVAYAFARLRWPGRDVIFVLLLSTMMLPPQVTMVPVFLIVRKLHWYNTLTPLWLPSFFGSAFFIFLLRQFLMTIPRDLEDAAKIDGCSYFGLYWRIMLPLIRPALAAVAIFQFLGSWNDFMGPLIYINDLRLTPLSLGLFQFQQEHAAEWGMLMAGSLLMTLPAILIFFLAQKHFIQGITLTGIK